MRRHVIHCQQLPLVRQIFHRTTKRIHHQYAGTSYLGHVFAAFPGRVI
jgi:hypothetical protein